ncbi:MAG TPA: hypothetical protein VFY40_08260 [Blastocatellia bacterium]|nr:hypothetical protein [Blastocatellia bacterium]
MSPDQLRAQNALVAAQVALALVLLVASGLLIRTFLALRGVPPGFRSPEQIQTIRIVISNTQAPEPERVARMQAEISDKLSRLELSSELIERHSPCVIRSLAEGRRQAPMLLGY